MTIRKITLNDSGFYLMLNKEPVLAISIIEVLLILLCMVYFVLFNDYTNTVWLYKAIVIVISALRSLLLLFINNYNNFILTMSKVITRYFIK